MISTHTPKQGRLFTKKTITAFLLGILLSVSVFALAFADQPIKLIVNGKEVPSDVPPQVINGRTLVPARALAEALGATVAWDEAQNAVVVTGGVQVVQSYTPTQGLISLRDIAKLPGVQVMSDKNNYIVKDSVKIILNFTPETNIFPISVETSGKEIETSQARIINGQTYLPIDLLRRHGFIIP